MNKIDLNHRTAVITGGAQGIGFAVARRLIESGAQVVLWDRDTSLSEEAAAELGHGTGAVTVDVAQPSSVDEELTTTSSLIPRIDILINSAGIAGPNQPTWDYPPDAWRDVIDINLNGTYYCCRAVLPGMLQQNYGRVLNIASIAGKEGNPTASAYSASKAAVIALTKSLGKETATRDIAINCITPAAAQTKILEQVSEQHIQYMLSKIPRERFVTVEEIASMVAWIVSSENSYTTGAVFDLSGGRATY